MSSYYKKKEKDIATIILAVIFVISILAILGLLIYGAIKVKNDANDDKKSGFVPSYDDDEIYHLNEKVVVDFSEPIIEQFNKESQLIVSSADASIDVNLKQKGLLDIGALNKTQKIKYKGTGRFYVDLSENSEVNITVDDENKTVTISIPHTKLLPIEIDPNRFESEDAKKGFLAFGDLKFTPKEYNDLQVECKSKLEKSINTKENRIKADENAIEEIIKIYDPIVKSVDDSYSVEAVFYENLGTTE